MKASIVISGGPESGTVLVLLRGAIDGSVSTRIFDDVYAFHKEHPQLLKYLFDFDDVTEFDGKAISDLIGFHHLLARHGGQMVIARPDAEILQLFEKIGLSSSIEIARNLPEAEALLSAPEYED